VGASVSAPVTLSRVEYRPVFAIPGVKEQRLILSFAEAVEVLGDECGDTLRHLFVSGQAMRGVWFVPHPDHQEPT